MKIKLALAAALLSVSSLATSAVLVDTVTKIDYVSYGEVTRIIDTDTMSVCYVVAGGSQRPAISCLPVDSGHLPKSK